MANNDNLIVYSLLDIFLFVCKPKSSTISLFYVMHTFYHKHVLEASWNYAYLPLAPGIYPETLRLSKLTFTRIWSLFVTYSRFWIYNVCTGVYIFSLILRLCRWSITSRTSLEILEGRSKDGRFAKFRYREIRRFRWR